MRLKYHARLVSRGSALASTHVFPPSSDRYRPDFFVSDFFTSISAYTRLPSGATATPARPSIDGFVDAPVFARTIHVPQSADVNDAWILWIDRDPADLARVLQADVLPR